jgi:pimeloyl-ACP methyl ester carboxylesterase
MQVGTTLLASVAKMENVKFGTSHGLQLSGIWFAARSDAALVCAHGFAGEKTSKGRFTRLGEVLSPLGYNVLSFDFAGCGESDDALLTSEQQQDDFRNAITYAKSRGMKRIALVGNSMGSYMALRVYTPEIKTMLLLAALTGPTQYDWEAFYSPEQMHEWRTTGRVTMTRDEPYFRRTVVDGKLLDECGSFDQGELLRRVRCPVLIIHGDGDEEERKLLAQSRKGIELLPAGSRLVVLPGANHRMEGRLGEIVELAKDWFADKMPVNSGQPSAISRQ